MSLAGDAADDLGEDEAAGDRVVRERGRAATPGAPHTDAQDLVGRLERLEPHHLAAAGWECRRGASGGAEW